MVQNVPYNAQSFLSFLGNLIITLHEKKIFKGVFIMDNVRFHKVNEIKVFIENSGFVLKFLPPYSPFLNPIENMFSKCKNFVRRVSVNNEQQLISSINSGASLITPEDCEGFYRNMISYIPRSINNEMFLD
jgi:transposase